MVPQVCAGAKPAANGAAAGAIAGQPISDRAEIRLREFFWGKTSRQYAGTAN